MRKLTKRIAIALLCIAALGSLLHALPEITGFLFGSARLEWVSERFSETLKEESELVVFEVEVTAQETVTQDAWLIGTVQKIQIPYTFAVRYTIDLSQAELFVTDDSISILLPAPQAKYQQLTVDEENVKKQDWLYPLTAERYAEIKTQLEKKLHVEYSNNQVYLDEAWGAAVNQIESIFESLIQYNLLLKDCRLQITEMNS